MALAGVRVLSVARGAFGIASIAAPTRLCSALGFTAAQTSPTLCQLIGAREIGLGFLLWPRLGRRTARPDGGVQENLLPAESGTGIHDSTKATDMSAAEAMRLRDTLMACILVDTIDIVLCAAGFVDSELTTRTVVELGGIGVFGVGASTLVWSLQGRLANKQKICPDSRK